MMAKQPLTDDEINLARTLLPTIHELRAGTALPEAADALERALDTYRDQRDAHLAALSALALLISSTAHLARRGAWDGSRWLGSSPVPQAIQHAVWSAQRRYVEACPEPAFAGPHGPRLATMVRISDRANELSPDTDLLGLLARLAKGARLLAQLRSEGLHPDTRECLEDLAAAALRLLEEPRR